MKIMKKNIFTIFAFFIILSLSQAQNTWVQKADYGGGFTSASTAFTINGKAYLGTGFDSFSGEALSSFWEYNPISDTWSQKADMGGSPRGYALSFSLNSKGYVGGGFDGLDPVNDFWEYNPTNNTWTQKADMGGPSRLSGSAFSIDEKGYIGLGYNFETDKDLKDFWEYNPTNNTWTQKTNFGGHARQGAASFAVEGKGYIGTGYDYDNDVDLKDFWEYNPASNSWFQKSEFGGSTREFASGFAIGSNGFITCGYNYENDLLLKDMWQYSPADNAWTQKASMVGLERQVAAAFSIGSKGYICGGYNFDLELNDLWQYTPSTTNQAPVSNAGPDVTLDLPVNSTLLNGSGSDPDGIIVNYTWSQVGITPSIATILNSMTATPTVSDLIQGTYTFLLTVTDDDGDIATDEVLVTVNAAQSQAPIANAGADITVELPLNSATLDGSGTDADGIIVEYAWTQDGNNPSSATISDPGIMNPVVSDLLEGVYTFILTVTDDDGLTASDKVMVTVKLIVNEAPMADAGSDIHIILPVNATQLNGSGTDPEGNPLTFEWQQIGNEPSNATISDAFIANPIVSDLLVGTYSFRLTVTDDKGLTSTDDVDVVVDSIGNIFPIVYAGLDTTLILPTDSTQLNGSATDEDGIIIGYEWSQVGNDPSIAIISDPTILNPLITGMIEGTYTFRLSAIDDNGDSSFDEVSIFVVDTNNHAPIADAGLDIELTLPQDSTFLSGIGTDVDGTIISYSWDQLGDTPSIANISDSTVVDPLISGLIEGIYTFVLTVTDDDGAIDTDTVLVVVNPIILYAPIANAGEDINLIFPTDSVEVNGSATDADGTIVSYHWEQSGITPSVATISDTTIANPIISDLIFGTYTFILTVTDNDGLTDKDTLLIKLDSLQLLAPLADAGEDINITLPVSNVALDGNGTDEDGTIIGIHWAQIGNTPSMANISDTASFTPVISDLKEGTYTFVLTVVDNDDLFDSDTVLVIVNPAVNVAPTANAGTDISILLPTNSAVLNGSGTDADGTIVSYAWEQVGSTPNNATIIGISTPNPTVASLIIGTYTFKLTVTDDDGATASDEVQVIVEDGLATDPLDLTAPSVYPNPSPNGRIIVESGSKIKLGSKVALISIEGKPLQEFIISSNKQHLDLSNYAAGCYFLHFENGAKAKVIIIQ